MFLYVNIYLFTSNYLFISLGDVLQSGNNQSKEYTYCSGFPERLYHYIPTNSMRHSLASNEYYQLF